MDYVHGYSTRESQRLTDQARTLVELLHDGVAYPAGSRVLEAGCGVGAQTLTLAHRSPGAHFVAVDRSAPSLATAREAVLAHGLSNVELLEADLFALPFAEGSFDHVFLCFVLEHAPEPERLLRALSRVLKPGGTLTAIEGDHGSTFFHPDDADARRSIECLVELQAAAGGNALIGRELYPLLARAGLGEITVAPLVVYADAGHPGLVAGFTLATFTAMIEGVEAAVLASGKMTRAEWERAVAALRRTAEADGTFNYTFFRGVGVKGATAR